MASDDDDFDRAWEAAQDALRSRLRAFLAGGRLTVRLDREEAWVALCALDREAPLEAERDAFRSRYRAIDKSYAGSRKAEAALDAGRIPSRGDPRAKRLAMLAADYELLTSGSGAARLIHPAWRPRLADPTDRPLAIPHTDILSVERPLVKAYAVKRLAAFYAFPTARACLAALERHRVATGAAFELPQRIDVE